MVRRHLRLLPWLLTWVSACNCENLGVERIPGEVTATLCDAVTGQPAPGQVLSVESGGETQEATSSDDGSAAIGSVPSGDITVRVKHHVNGTYDARLDHSHKLTLDDGATHAFIDPSCLVFPLAPGKGGIQGQVCNRHTGSLLGNAEVIVRSTTGEERQTTTDGAGFFLLNDVSPGDHSVTIRGEGFQKTWPAHVESGQITHLALGGNCRPVDPSNGAIEGRLCANNGEGPWALARAFVTLSDNSVLEDISDIEGHFLIEGVPPGTWDVHVEGGGESQTLMATVTSGATTTLNPASNCPVPNPDETGDVRGQLCDPVAGGWLLNATARAVQDGRTFQDNTDERGRFHLAGLAPGLVVVEVTRGDYLRQFEVPITAGATVTVADGVCAPPTGQCRTEELQLEDAEPLSIMLVVDKSGSMVESFDTGTTKWQGAVTALKAVTQRLQSEAAFGVALYPAGDDAFTQCSPGNVVVNPSANNAGQIANALDGTSPGGGTPTAGALTIVRHWFEANSDPDQPPLVILATDGVPNCDSSENPNTCTCPPEGCDGLAELCLDDDGALASVSALADMGIRTYVIGLPGSMDPTDVLTRMATAGGTNAGDGQAYYAPGNTMELVEDMTEIVETNRTCRFELEAAPNDPAAMEVTLDGSVIPRDQSRRNGWDLVGTKGIELFGGVCNTIRTGVEHDFSVRYCVDS